MHNEERRQKFEILRIEGQSCGLLTSFTQVILGSCLLCGLKHLTELFRLSGKSKKRDNSDLSYLPDPRWCLSELGKLFLSEEDMILDFLLN
jgi:hypothetical protein